MASIVRSVIAVVFVVLVFGVPGCLDAPAPGATPDPSTVEAPKVTLPPLGTSAILFQPPAPWFVEGLAIHGDRAFTGTAFGATGTPAPLLTRDQPSRIYVFDVYTGTLLDTIFVEGEDQGRDHGVAGLLTDADGRLYAASTQLGVLRLTETTKGWTQEVYAKIPDLPMCSTLQPAPCSPTPDDEGPVANDMTWDADGNMYVSDSWQATVWKIPPGSAEERKAEIWYQHASLDRMFGPNGLRVDPARDRLILAVCCLDTFEVGPIDRASRLVTIPFPDPAGAEPKDLYVLANGEGADGIELNATGSIYIASNSGTKVLVVSPSGELVRAITNEDLVGPATFDFPATIAFHDETRSLLVTNYAYSDANHPSLSQADQRYVMSVAVDDVAGPRIRPHVP